MIYYDKLRRMNGVDQIGQISNITERSEVTERMPNELSLDTDPLVVHYRSFRAIMDDWLSKDAGSARARFLKPDILAPMVETTTRPIVHLAVFRMRYASHQYPYILLTICHRSPF